MLPGGFRKCCSRCLRQAIRVQKINSKGAKIQCNSGVEPGTASDQIANALSECRVNLSEEDLAAIQPEFPQNRLNFIKERKSDSA